MLTNNKHITVRVLPQSVEEGAMEKGEIRNSSSTVTQHHHSFPYQANPFLRMKRALSCPAVLPTVFRSRMCVFSG